MLAKKGVGFDFDFSIEDAIKLASDAMNVENLNEPNEARGSINDFIKGFYQADVC